MQIGDLRNLSDLGCDRGYILSTNSQDIEAAFDFIGAPGEARHVSGIVERFVDGDIVEIWVTQYSRPFDLNSSYELVMHA